ncbi:hypothetical protein BDP27DRAFT_720020 [Rhodocollybia butyracea]|uniref:Uncharacterized protein n=1 Tax=Rhodocollybia butyracea TaxID=206335 RepID=A0A9P5PU89_9AGAR|nr:hypothetical protein BDP27DRAFT_720020 [Rhodocollybia butyracea]
MNIGMHHASFGDFVMDPKRSGRYFIDSRDEAMAKYRAFYTLKCFAISVANIHIPDTSTLFFDWLNEQGASIEHMVWYEYCSQRVKLPDKRLLLALDQIDTRRLVRDAWKGGGHHPTKLWTIAVAFAVRVFWVGKVWRARLKMAKLYKQEKN